MIYVYVSVSYKFKFTRENETIVMYSARMVGESLVGGGGILGPYSVDR